jgi:CBS domain containing-hemolysin-like protein
MIPLGLFLLACLAVYVGTIRAAFTLLMRLPLRLAAERDGREGPLAPYLDNPPALFLSARLVLAVTSALAAVLLARQIGTEGVHRLALFGAAVFGFVVVCEQALPLVIARRSPEQVLATLLPSFVLATRLVRPLAFVLTRLDRPLRERPSSATEHVADGPVGQADRGEENGGVLADSDQRRLLQSIAEFGDTCVREVMTPRPDLVTIEADATLDDLRTVLRDQGYSRLPVYKESLDNILGFVFVKDLIQLPCDTDGSRPVTTVMRPAHFVPETKPVPSLLREFQREQLQIAIVVDEYGGTAGLVTIEDLLEELVGEIRDEYDREIEPVVEEGAETHNLRKMALPTLNLASPSSPMPCEACEKASAVSMLSRVVAPPPGLSSPPCRRSPLVAIPAKTIATALGTNSARLQSFGHVGRVSMQA